MRKEQYLSKAQRNEQLSNRLGASIAVVAIASGVLLNIASVSAEGSPPKEMVYELPNVHGGSGSQTRLQLAAPSDPAKFEGMTVISVDNPDDTITPRKTANELSGLFEDATRAISRSVDGTVRPAEHVNVVEVTAAPTGLSFKPEFPGIQRCYTHANLAKIYQSVKRQGDVSDDTLVPIVLQSNTDTCSRPKDSIAYVNHDYEAEDDGVYFSPRSLESSDDDARWSIEHESAHAGFYLQHAAAVTLHGRKLAMLSANESTPDIEYAMKGNFALVKMKPSKSEDAAAIDQYASMRTSMGGRVLSKESNADVFNFVELSQINDKSAPLEYVDPSVDGDYVIDTDPTHGDARGIAIKLPDTHPLRKQMSQLGDLEYMMLGLDNLDGDKTASLGLIGRFAERNTVAFDVTSYRPSVDYKVPGGVVVYADRTLGITITATAEKPADNATNSRMTLHVRKQTTPHQ